MAFTVFKQFRRRRHRHHDGMGNVSKLFVGAVSIEKHKQKFRLLKRRKPKLEDDIQEEFDVNNTIDHTDRESCSSNTNDSKEYIHHENSNEDNVAEVGCLPKRLLRKKETMTFMIHGFSESDKTRGQFYLSPAVQAHGYSWRLQLYPRGNDHSDETSEHLSCFLHYFASPRDQQAPFAQAEYVCGAYTMETQLCDYAIEKGKRSCCWGFEDFVQRDQVIRNYLNKDGTLCLKVNLHVAVDRRAVWYPPTMRQEPTLLQLYHSSEETGDTTFRVTSNQKGCRYYKAHKMILALRARILYELIGENALPDDEDEEWNDTAVELPGIDPEDFEAMLKHIYTIQEPVLSDEEVARKLLILADRFCLTDLKMYVESVLCDRFTFTNNAASLLLFSDAHSCALLKETTLDLYADDPCSFAKSASWPLVQESKKLLKELSEHVHTGCSFPNKLDVFSLREQLGEHGLGVDGSRETLLGRLKEWNNEAEKGTPSRE